MFESFEKKLPCVSLELHPHLLVLTCSYLPSGIVTFNEVKHTCKIELEYNIIQ